MATFGSINYLRLLFGSSAGRVVGNWSLYTIGGFLPQAISIFLLPVFTRYLSPNDYGILAYSAVIGTFFNIIGSLSIHAYVLRHYYDYDTAEGRRTLLGTILAFTIVYNAALLTSCFLIGPHIFAILQIQVPFSPFVEFMLVATAMEIIVQIPLSYFRVEEKASKFVLMSSVLALLNAGLSLYLVVNREMGLLGRYYGQLAADALMVIVSLYILSGIARVTWNSSIVFKAMNFCLPLIPAQFLAAFSTVSDRLILERFAPLSELGLYSVGSSLAYCLAIVSTGAYTAMQPQICRLASQSRLDDAILSIKRIVVSIYALMVCCAIAFSKDAIALLASSPFHSSYKIAILLIISMGIQAFLTIGPSLYLLATDRTKFEPTVRLGGAIVSLISMMILTPSLGIYGAGAASILSACTTLFFYERTIGTYSKVKWDFSRDLSVFFYAAILGCLVLQIQLDSIFVSIAAKLLVMAVVIGIYAFRAGSGLFALGNDIGTTFSGQ